MKKIRIKAPAKLNLNLHVFPLIAEESYHFIKSLNCSLTLCDEIVLEEKDKGIEIICSHSQVPSSKENLCYQATLQFKNYSQKGVKMKIIKNIPISAGLGGGSSDAAAVLRGLNKFWGLGLSEKVLLEMAQKIGMDVCYCLIGGVCLVSGFGEKIKKLNLKMPKIPVVIVVPQKQKPSTAWAYRNLDSKRIGKNESKLERLIQAIKVKNIEGIAKNLHNDFGYSIAKIYPEVSLAKRELLKSGSLKAMFCGSGFSVFGIFADEMSARKAYDKLKKKFENIFLTETR